MSELEDIWHKDYEDDDTRRRRYMSADPEQYRGEMEDKPLTAPTPLPPDIEKAIRDALACTDSGGNPIPREVEVGRILTALTIPFQQAMKAAHSCGFVDGVGSVMSKMETTVSERVREAECAMAQRAADRITASEECGARQYHVIDILALSPDPHWLERKELAARDKALEDAGDWFLNLCDRAGFKVEESNIRQGMNSLSPDPHWLERKEKAAYENGANWMFNAIIGSLAGYPNAGGDIGVMTEVERIEQAAREKALEDAGEREMSRDIHDPQRLWDLVRYNRKTLRNHNLITYEEYVELAEDHESVARLEADDAARTQEKS